MSTIHEPFGQSRKTISNKIKVTFPFPFQLWLSDTFERIVEVKSISYIEKLMHRKMNLKL